MSGGPAVAAALTFLWLGMVLAISFLEAPLKFRAPGVTLQLGLGIGRLVFRALIISEGVLAIAIVAALAVDPPSSRGADIAIAVAIAALVTQVSTRPWLHRRSAAVLAGPPIPAGTKRRRSRVHYLYVGLELVKVVALTAGGIVRLAG